jgi:prevent-host-death family protein
MLYIFMYIRRMSKPERYSIAEARSNLPMIVDHAEAGQEIELTRRGKPVAVVVSLRELERLRTDRPRFADAYKSFLRRYSLDEVGLEENFFDSIREKSGGREVAL